MKKKQSGKLIVLDGVDGSGKATQAGLLIQRLKKQGYQTALADFPRYDESFFGAMVGQFIQGKFGPTLKVNPYLASLLYALDRWQAKDQLNKWLAQGKVVVCNRYTSSSMMHQAAKFQTALEQKEYLHWLEEMEYHILGVLKPDLTVFLSVPHTIGRKLVRAKGHRNYLGGKAVDSLEKNKRHQQTSWEMAHRLSARFSWKVITCTKNGVMQDREHIAEQVWKTVQEVLK
ncbi:MAG: thymidylate kinase [Candidatus Nomurabacteria bacterium]|nr:MAG: thymidylate kinase [Candidatus Nomurabacteria bacterium]